MVKFPSSFAAFTEVLIDVYIDQKFTSVSKLFYRGKNPKCKHSISVLNGIFISKEYSILEKQKKNLIPKSIVS